MATTKRKKVEVPAEGDPVTAEAPVEESAEAPVEAPVKRPVTERLLEALSETEEGCPPALVQFEQRSGRPCTVLVENGEKAVRRAWGVWTEECGRNQEEFVMAVLDATDAWPARIMRPCTFVRLD